MRRKIVAVIGAGSPSGTEEQHAREVGRRLGERGFTLLTGGMGGVMRAASQACQAAGGLVIGVLPVSDPDGGNEHVDISIATGMGDARNAIITNSAEVFIAIGGSYGTLSEIAFALKRNKPVIRLDTWALDTSRVTGETIIQADSPEQAVDAAARFVSGQ